ncbi:Zn-ribbon domain-containing OB-fold protein [Candidatus Thiosymbion oneisti]|uniref:Zn-ribbon domain-containing OB-fold protein n=1 Tax=Candidatus Thiosymbion oneisti TaxID=589554 RepID=UPI000B7CD6EA|nr:Zn-ribbon domain-containing OB-fold protein [Candidatus Thiosymbion oneisti]
MSKDAYNAAGFYEFVAEKKLMGTRCKSSGELFLPPRPFSPSCSSGEMEWVEMSGKGKLEAFTVTLFGPTRMVEAGYGPKNPYCVGIVRLDEGPAISAQILGLDLTKPEAIKIGTPMGLTFIDRTEGEEKKTYIGFKAT